MDDGVSFRRLIGSTGSDAKLIILNPRLNYTIKRVPFRRTSPMFVILYNTSFMCHH